MTVILPANETHIHPIRTIAVEAAKRAAKADPTIDIDELHYYRAETAVGGRWGWTTMAAAAATELAAPKQDVSIEALLADLPGDDDSGTADIVEDHEDDLVADPASEADNWDQDQADAVRGSADPDDEADELTAEQIMARNAERLAAAAKSEPIHGCVDADGFFDPALAPEDEPAVVQGEVLPTESGADDADENQAEQQEPVTLDAPSPDEDRAAQTGDVILAIRRLYTEAGGILEAERLAKKLGLTFIVHDAMTMREIARVEAKGRARGAGGEKAPKGERRSGPNEKQAKLIELCTRVNPETGKLGATSMDLFAAGLGGDSKKNTIPWRQEVMKCERFGYRFRLDSDVVNNRAVTRYTLEPVDTDA